MPRGAKPKQYDPMIVSRVRTLYYGEGMTQTEVAEALGTTQKVVWNLMRRHGMKPRVAAKRDQRGPANSSWKGEDAGYAALHLRVYSARGAPMLCEVCGCDDAKSFDWACVTGDYTDIDAYVRMCRSCHSRHDGTVRNLKGGVPE